MNIFHVIGDVFAAGNEAYADYEKATEGQAFDLTGLATQILGLVEAFGLKLGNWVTVPVVVEALTLAFQFIKSKKPATPPAA